MAGAFLMIAAACLLLPTLLCNYEERQLLSEAGRPHESLSPPPPTSSVQTPTPSPSLFPEPSASEAPSGSAKTSPAPSPPERPGLSTFHQENVLGTSFRLVVVGGAVGERYLRVALAEIERHRKTFSRHDPQSELSRINALPWEKRRSLRLSKYLARVLRWAASWHARSKGAFAPYGGLLFRRLEKATPDGEPPTPEPVGVGYRLTKSGKTYLLECDRDGSFDLDAIAKGFIVDRALRAVMRSKPRPRGALVDIGGDLGVAGSSDPDRVAPWEIEVADPRRPAENAQPLDRIELRGMCIASSGGYARPRARAGGTRQPHLFDPRRGEAARGVLGATVVAPDAASADALATILCVLPTKESLALIEATPGTAALIMDFQGHPLRSRRWRSLRRKAAPSVASKSREPWPAGFALQVSFTLRESRGRGKRRKFKRHGTAVWIEDSTQKRVRLLALWHDRGELKYLRELPSFWWEGWVLSGGPNDPKALRSTTRASRAPGTYELEWDGLDDAGAPVPRGQYRVRIDLNRENGPPRGREEHTTASVEIQCGASAASGSCPDQAELAGVTVTYRRRP
ncbi:MAG: DUF2271 domain-containing protein [Planctomycetes bacterium]|nr:DUF2271 domain-containing protein [Planctomycetota bacterium]